MEKTTSELNITPYANGQLDMDFSAKTKLTVEDARALYYTLKLIFEKQQDEEPTLPEEPEEAGLYAAQNGLLLLKEVDGDWSYKKSPYVENGYFENCCEFDEYSTNWELIVETIGMDAFPLKRITERDVIALAQYSNEQ